MQADPRESRLFRDLRAEEDEPAFPTPEKIGKYAILKEIARTGSSVVFLARHPELGGNVVLKLLQDTANLEEHARRLRREAALASSLRHPNVITVHDVGIWESPPRWPIPYVVMDYLEGGTLAGKQYPPQQAAETVAALAHAIEFAHQSKIIHRDLKPANVLLTRDGRPVVTDFGLAKAAAPSNVLTQSGTLLGTPQYMAPEQVRGDLTAVGPRTDIYALGAILYELLTGVPPFPDRGTTELFQSILSEEPGAPSRRVPGIPRELDIITLKALEKDPERRYASAQEFAGDLERHLKGEPILAHPAPLLSVAWRGAKRRPALAAFAASGLAILLLVGLIVSIEKKSRARKALSDAARWEKEGDLWKARDSFRVALDAEGSPEAYAGFDRTDAQLRRALGGKAGTPKQDLSDSWAELQGSASDGGVSCNSGGKCYGPSLALATGDLPVLAWTRGRDPATADIYVKRWDGSSWVGLGRSAEGGGISNLSTESYSGIVSLDLDADGRPTVAWQANPSGEYGVYVRRWNGSEWEALGPSAEGTGISSPSGAYPSLKLDPKGRPVVAWYGAGPDIYVSAWNGSGWSELGGRVSEGAGKAMWPPCLALDNESRPVVTWWDRADGQGRILVRRWDHSSWRPLGASDHGIPVGDPGHAIIPKIALGPQGQATVAWTDAASGPKQVYLRRWDGSAWVELGGSASGGGISRSTIPASFNSLALDSKGNPVVAYWLLTSPQPPNSEIYLKRWNGEAWIEVGGSGSGGGISHDAGGGSGAAVALTNSGQPVVAWEDRSSGAFQIYLRRWTR